MAAQAQAPVQVLRAALDEGEGAAEVAGVVEAVALLALAALSTGTAPCLGL